MEAPRPSFLLLLLLLLLVAGACRAAGDHRVPRSMEDAVGLTREALAQVKVELSAIVGGKASMRDDGVGALDVALVDCTELYEDSEYRLLRAEDPYDVRVAVSAALTSHRTCLDGVAERGLAQLGFAANVSRMLRKALEAASTERPRERNVYRRNLTIPAELGMLSAWDPSLHMAEYVVAKDGSGSYHSIKDALEALEKAGRRGGRRVVIHVRAGVYNENVEIKREMRNIMMVGDGINRTVVTGSRNVPSGYTTYRSATLGVVGDGFWARDITFENTAGPARHQAVALRVSSDRSAFYRCGIRGYQDTLFLHSSRQFYRECDIYGTIDFLFGNAAAVLQRCTIVVRKPMPHQSNMITAQGRDDPGDNTAITIHDSRVVPAGDLEASRFKTFLGRPWKRYSRTVFMKTNLDGLVNPRGWAQWRGGFALNTLYYAEYMNTGAGAGTSRRVNWPGFHVLRSVSQTDPFTVSELIQGETWLPETGVPFAPGL